MDETNYITTEAPSLIGVGVQSVVEQAKQLGLTWTLQPGTMVTPLTSIGTVTLDGDTVGITCANLTASTPAAGGRVMVLLTPTGNYVIGSLGEFNGPWFPMVLENSWTNSASGVSVVGAYRRVAPNSVHLVGELTPGTVADGTTIATLPFGFRPRRATAFPVARNPGALALLGPLFQLLPTGILRAYGMTGALTVWFSNIVPLDAP